MWPCSDKWLRAVLLPTPNRKSRIDIRPVMIHYPTKNPRQTLSIWQVPQIPTHTKVVDNGHQNISCSKEVRKYKMELPAPLVAHCPLVNHR
jgi:hypothetical protein